MAEDVVCISELTLTLQDGNSAFKAWPHRARIAAVPIFALVLSEVVTTPNMALPSAELGLSGAEFQFLANCKKIRAAIHTSKGVWCGPGFHGLLPKFSDLILLVVHNLTKPWMSKYLANQIHWRHFFNDVKICQYCPMAFPQPCSLHAKNGGRKKIFRKLQIYQFFFWPCLHGPIDFNFFSARFSRRVRKFHPSLWRTQKCLRKKIHTSLRHFLIMYFILRK